MANITVPLKFIKNIHYCTDNMNRIQIRVKNLETNKEFWMLITKTSKLFSKCHNLGMGYVPEFTELIRYDADRNNRAVVVTDPEIRLKYSMYLI